MNCLFISFTIFLQLSCLFLFSLLQTLYALDTNSLLDKGVMNIFSQSFKTGSFNLAYMVYFHFQNFITFMSLKLELFIVSRFSLLLKKVLPS